MMDKVDEVIAFIWQTLLIGLCGIVCGIFVIIAKNSFKNMFSDVFDD